MAQVDEDKALPGGHRYRHQSIAAALKVANAAKFRRALQRSIQSIGPTVVRAAQVLGDPAGAR